jgi:Tfp pilus assembly protein PilF
LAALRRLLLELWGRRFRRHARERAAALTSYGAFLASKKRWQDAEHRLREAVERDPSSATAHVNLGNLVADLQQGAAAEAEYRRAVELDPRIRTRATTSRSSFPRPDVPRRRV